MNLNKLTIKKFHSGLINKEFSALEVVQGYFRRIEEKDEEIGAYLSLLEDDAIQAAERVDLAIAKNEDLPDLAGVPMAIKDNILIEGTRTTAGSKALDDYKASYDAGVIKGLRDKMAVFLGKTNLDEFAMGSSTENSGFQITKNPLDPERVPGGSSGGPAAAVAARMCFAALGTDTGGSVRQPAAFCGVSGLKTSYGRISRYGLIAYGSSLDTVGALARNIADLAPIFSLMAGHDPLDSTSVTDPVPEIRLNGADLRELRIGVPKEYFIEGLQPEVETAVREAIDAFRGMGFPFAGPTACP